MPSNRQEFLFYWGFLGPPFLITIIQLNKPIIIAIMIVIMPYFYLLLCHKPISDVSQILWFSAYCLVTHLLQVIRDMLHSPWEHFNRFVTHLMCLKMIRNKLLCSWAVAHYLVAYILRFKMSWDLSSPPWTICKKSHIIYTPWPLQGLNVFVSGHKTQKSSIFLGP